MQSRNTRRSMAEVSIPPSPCTWRVSKFLHLYGIACASDFSRTG
ncbi:hypothetical protein A2U01_0046639, partial [Trifolium medium]|nr:hypothetical protein [Trifolium medium]